jgi:hypothetical protein
MPILPIQIASPLSPLTPNAPCELDILRHDCHTLRVDCAQVGVLKEPHKVRLRSLLKRRHGRALEPQVGLEVLSDLADQTLKGELSDQELRAFLVLSDLSEGHRPWPEPVGLLHSAGGWSGLPGSLCGQLLPRSLASGGLASGLLGASHWKARISKKEDGKCFRDRCECDRMGLEGRNLCKIGEGRRVTLAVDLLKVIDGCS